MSVLSVYLILSYVIHTIKADYVIQLRSEASLTKFIDQHPYILEHICGNSSFGTFHALYGEFEPSFIDKARSMPDVVDIAQDSHTEVMDVQVDAPRHLARLSQEWPLEEHQPFDYVYDGSAGKGVDIYIFDTGITPNHEEFGGRLSRGIDCTGNGFGDRNGHGTHTAGVIGSKSFGVAKGANLIDVKVVSDAGRGKLSWILQGMNMVVKAREKSKRPSIVNMSIGTKRNLLLNRAVKQLFDMDVPVVTSAGNKGVSACSQSPASEKSTFVIGAYNDRNNRLAPFSNWGRCVDSFASGVNVQTLSHLSSHGSVLVTGTSIASGIGAGLVAYYMGMGDGGAQAVNRCKEMQRFGVLEENDFIDKPSTINGVLFNDAGDPLW